MTIDNKIKDVKLRYDMNKNHQHYHQVKLIDMNAPRSQEILPSDHSRMIEQAKFTYSSLRKAFEKRIKIIKDPRNKQVEGLKSLKTTKQNLAIVDAIPDDQLNQLKIKQN